MSHCFNSSFPRILFGILFFLTTPKSQSATVTVAGVNYDISVLSISYDNRPSLFSINAMPWFVDYQSAADFAMALGSALDQPGWNPFSPSPVFAYDASYISDPDEPWATRWVFGAQFEQDLSDPANPYYGTRFHENASDQSQNFAVLTSAVPEPSSVFLAGMGISLIFLLRSRR